MPNIRQYNNQIEGLRPDTNSDNAWANAANAEAQAGYRIGRSYDEQGRDIGQAVGHVGAVAGRAYERYVVQPEISKGSANVALLSDNLSREWQDIAAKSDPNDASIREKFLRERFEPEMEKFSNAFETEPGRVWGQQRADRMREHFFDKTAADMSVRSGIAIQQNLNTLGNVSTTGSYNDPTNLDFNLENYETSVRSMIDNAPNLTPQQRAAMEGEIQKKRKDMIQSAFRGMADQNPVAAKAWIESGMLDKYGGFSGEEKSQLVQYAHVMEKGKRADANAAKAELRAQQKAAGEVAQNKVLTDNVEFTPDGSMRIKKGFFQETLKLAQLPGINREEVTGLFAAGRAIQDDAEKGKKAVDDPTTYENFRKRFQLPDDEPGALSLGEIHQARADGQLSNESYRMFLQATKSEEKNVQKTADMARFNKYLDLIKPTITQASAFSPGNPVAAQRWGEFQRDKMEQFLAQRRAGKSVDALLHQGSADYIGKDIQLYRPTLQQLTAAMVEGSVPTPNPNFKMLPPVRGFVPPDQRLRPGESTESLARRLAGGQGDATPTQRVRGVFEDIREALKVGIANGGADAQGEANNLGTGTGEQ